MKKLIGYMKVESHGQLIKWQKKHPERIILFITPLVASMDFEAGNNKSTASTTNFSVFITYAFSEKEKE